jgi:hypothetical protein
MAEILSSGGGDIARGAELHDFAVFIPEINGRGAEVDDLAGKVADEVEASSISRPANMLIRNSTLTSRVRRTMVSSGSSENTSTANRSNGSNSEDSEDCEGVT